MSGHTHSNLGPLVGNDVSNTKFQVTPEELENGSPTFDDGMEQMCVEELSIQHRYPSTSRGCMPDYGLL